MNQMVVSKVDVGTNMVTPMMVAGFLEENYEEHIETVRDMLHRKKDVLVASVREHFGPTVEFYEPRGGMVMWFKFPEDVDTMKPLAAAKKRGLDLQSGGGVVGGPGESWVELHSDMLRATHGAGASGGDRGNGGGVSTGVGPAVEVFLSKDSAPTSPAYAALEPG